MPRPRGFLRCLASTFFLLGLGVNAGAAPREKENVWNLGFALEQMRYEAQSDQFFGQRGTLSFGYGKFQRQLYYGFNADILMGPYTEILEEKVKTDFYGTGFNVKTSYAFTGDGFRNANGSWSLDLGLSYSDTVGRSVAKSPVQDDKRVISELSMRVSQFNGLVSISYNKMLPARPLGNDPELLMTRIEGYAAGLGVTYPIKATYSMRYREEKGKVGNSDGYTREKTERGSLTGYSVFFNFSVFLGV